VTFVAEHQEVIVTDLVGKDVDSFTHRVGRTARAGKRGEAISLVATDEDKKFFKQILFNYNGQIALKSVNPGDLPVIAESPRGERPAPRHGGQQRRRRFQR